MIKKGTQNMHRILDFIYNYYYVFLLPFLSISVFYAMEYLSRGLDFFVSEKGVRWKFLFVTAFIQFFVSVIITWSVVEIFTTEAMQEYQTFQVVAMIILGSTPFNISILIWVAIKLEIYRFMRSRYKDDFKEEELLFNKYEKRFNKDSMQEVSKNHNKDASLKASHDEGGDTSPNATQKSHHDESGDALTSGLSHDENTTIPKQNTESI